MGLSIRTTGLALLGVLSLPACKKDEPSGSAAGTSGGAASAAAVAPAATVAAAAATATGASNDTTEVVCPFPRRCTDACWKAHFAALEACSAEWQVIEKEFPNVKEMGECTARCLTSTKAAGCVGAATKEECACTKKCMDGASAAQKAKGEPYLRCYAKKVAAACY